jgi:hypothetical protein
MCGAFAGKAQTLTCTFQFVASGTVGAQTFTKANITITTVGFTGNITPKEQGLVVISNTSASINISGVGTFQFVNATSVAVNIFPVKIAAPGTWVSEGFYFDSRGTPSGDLLSVGQITIAKGDEWNMLTSVGPFSDYITTQLWNYSPVLVSDGYTLNLYDGNSPFSTFQAVLTPGVPCSGSPSGNVADVQAVLTESLGTTPADADLNGDGVINVVDVQLVTNAVLGCGVSGTTPASFRMRAVAHGVQYARKH